MWIILKTVAVQVSIEGSGFLVFRFCENLEHRRDRPALDCGRGNAVSQTDSYQAVAEFGKENQRFQELNQIL
jgi:hypothetical protein